MHTPIQAKIHRETAAGTWFIVLAAGQSLTDTVKPFSTDGLIPGELRLDDGRMISSDQRRKAYATLRDLSDWNGDLPEVLKEHMKYRFMETTGSPYFSLSDCDMTTARHFITYLIDFALEHGIPLFDTAVNRAEDIDAYLHSCLMHKRCAVCGKDGEFHHVTPIGMGRNRLEICHLGLLSMCLCRDHHTGCHTEGQSVFDEKYKIYGIVADEMICKVWSLKQK